MRWCGDREVCLRVSDLSRSASEPHSVSPSEVYLGSSASERHAIAGAFARSVEEQELGQHCAMQCQSPELTSRPLA